MPTTTSARSTKPAIKTPADTKPATKVAAKSKSVQVHATMVKAPAGNGGFRFSEVAAKDGSKVLGDFYVNQEGYRELGSPLEIVVSIKVA